MEPTKKFWAKLEEEMLAAMYRNPNEVYREVISHILKDENFYPTIMQVDKDPLTFIAIGKKGRCYDNRYSVYEIRLTKDLTRTGYEGVLNSFVKLRDAVTYQFKVLAEKNK